MVCLCPRIHAWKSWMYDRSPSAMECVGVLVYLGVGKRNNRGVFEEGDERESD